MASTLSLLGLQIIFLLVILASTLLASLLPIVLVGKFQDSQNVANIFNLSKSFSNGIFSCMVIALIIQAHVTWMSTTSGHLTMILSLSTQLLGFYLALFADFYIKHIGNTVNNNNNNNDSITDSRPEQDQDRSETPGDGDKKTKTDLTNLSLPVQMERPRLAVRVSDISHAARSRKPSLSYRGDLSPKDEHYVSLTDLDQTSNGFRAAETPTTEYIPDYGSVVRPQTDPPPAPFRWDCHTGCNNSISPTVTGPSAGTLNILLFLASVGVHNIFEGLTLGLQQTIDQAVTLFVPLLFHAILLSAAISVAIITSQDEININKTIAYLSVFCTFRPLGILIGVLVGQNESYTSSVVTCVGQSLSAGVFLHITFFNMIPSDFNNMQDKAVSKLSAFVSGGLALLLLHLVMAL